MAEFIEVMKVVTEKPKQDQAKGERVIRKDVIKKSLVRSFRAWSKNEDDAALTDSKMTVVYVTNDSMDRGITEITIAEDVDVFAERIGGVIKIVG